MNTTRRSLLGCTAALLLPLPALAIKRGFPKDAVRGQMTFGRGREVVVNGRREQLPLGTRVYDERSRPPLRGALEGKTFTVNYIRDRKGFIRKVWLLSPQEMQKPMPADAATQGYQQEQLLKSLYMN